MDDERFDDLKQFVANTVHQSEKRLDEKISSVESRLEAKIDSLRQEMLDGFAGVADTIDEMHKRSDERDAAIDKRFTRLEQRPA